MDIKQISPTLFVGPQIEETDLRELASAGFTDVICNRPDAEHPGHAPSQRMAKIAKGLGLGFHYLPISPGELFDKQAKRLAGVVAKPNTKVFAYCRSGMRAANAWSLAQANQSGLYA